MPPSPVSYADTLSRRAGEGKTLEPNKIELKLPSPDVATMPVGTFYGQEGRGAGGERFRPLGASWNQERVA